MTPKCRRVQPSSFTVDDVVSALNSSAVVPAEYARVRKDPKEEVFIKIDWGKKVDKEALWHWRELLKHLLLKNSSGIFKKKVVIRGLTEWDSLSDRGILSKGTHIDNSAMAIVALAQMLCQYKKGMTTGVRA